MPAAIWRRREMPALIELAGQRFDRLLVVERSQNRRKYTCVCDCGETVSVVVANLKRGMTRSCGCLQRELLGQRNMRHGMRTTSTYISWKSMIRRCTKPKARDWGDYGGRGITVCARWLDFSNFFEDMGEKPEDGKWSIERLDNDLGYFAGNCKWATMLAQANNRRPRGQGSKAKKKESN